MGKHAAGHSAARSDFTTVGATGDSCRLRRSLSTRECRPGRDCGSCPFEWAEATEEGKHRHVETKAEGTVLLPERGPGQIRAERHLRGCPCRTRNDARERFRPP
jgi:hypothetical protein